MLCLYLLCLNCLYLTFLPYLSSKTYSRKYEKLLNKVVHACKNITEKNMNLLKMRGPKIRLCFFTFRPIALKQLHSLTTIHNLSWLGGAEVSHPLKLRDVQGSITGSVKDFYVWVYVLLLLCFYFLSNNTSFVTKFCNSFCVVNLFSMLNILQDLLPSIRVLRYRPSIFKNIYIILYNFNKNIS